MLLQIVTYFGYLASVFLIIALLVKTDAQFRIFNILGTIVFMIYGVIFQAWPVVITNAILFFINGYYLLKLYTRKESFDLIEIAGDEKLVKKFIAFYAADIKAYFPEFDPADLAKNLSFIVLRDLMIANIFSASLSAAGDAIVELNYTLPRFRDFKIGKFIFEKEKQFLTGKGVGRILYERVAHKGHAKFLRVTGFQSEGERFYKMLK